MKKPRFDISFNDEDVEDFGSCGQCFGCKRVFEETALIMSQPYCRNCVSKKFPNDTAKFVKTDAKFSCPSCGPQCGVKNLSCDQYMVGTCCENASSWIGNDSCHFANYWSLNKIYAESRDEEGNAETKPEIADMKVKTSEKALENAKKVLEDAENALEHAKNLSKATHAELNEKKKWRRTVQKRTLFLATIALKDDNSDLQNDNGQKRKNQKADAQNQTDAGSETCKFSPAEENRQKA
ncbi:unnamed protein product [Oikopleura dioica]|uniref:Uncharacterized protein n=1 Tax=Oikopleura dioica TaxID=34765 RepID=E4YFN0_OIKDI|nr:unnamed protein product [Oikopleura dioica]